MTALARADGIRRVRMTPLDADGNPSGPTIDLGVIGDLVDQVTDAFHRIGEAAVTAMAALTNNLMTGLSLALDVSVTPLVPRYAVERLGVTEADIRSWTLTEVRLWNHRRIPIHAIDVIDWLALRGDQ